MEGSLAGGGGAGGQAEGAEEWGGGRGKAGQVCRQAVQRRGRGEQGTAVPGTRFAICPRDGGRGGGGRGGDQEVNTPPHPLGGAASGAVRR